MTDRIKSCGTSDPDALAKSLLDDFHRRARDGVELVQAGYQSEGLLAVGQPTLWASGLGEERVVAVMDPQVAEAMRRQTGWADAMIANLRYASEHSGSIRSDADRRRRLRRFLNALNAAMGLHPDTSELAVRDDLALLGLALDALDVGMRHPILRTPEGMGNRPPDTKLVQQFRAYVVAFILILEQSGLSTSTACAHVASELNRAKVPPISGATSGGHKPGTLRRWYYEARPPRSADEGTIGKKLSGDADLVARMIIGFVDHALSEGQKMPPTVDYAKEVIRRTVEQPTFRMLVP